MTDPKPVFDTLRPWLDASGFTPARIAALNAVLAAFNGNHGPVFDLARPWLDREGYTTRRINALDAVLQGLERGASTQRAGEAAHDAADVGMAAGGALSALADDRYLPAFQRVASSSAKPETVRAMAQSFAVHAPAFGQDASKARIAEFVAQIANETGGFRVFEEDLRYRADTLVRQWPSHFTRAQAAAAVGNPIEIASRAYGGRMGNAPYPSQDGYTYRGRGALQLTGREAYRRYGGLTGLPLESNPGLASDPADSVLIALAFFKDRGVNVAIDAGDFTKARRITNGGSIGLENVARLRGQVLEALR